MCGIVGLVPVSVKDSQTVDSYIREASMRMLSTQLLLNIESRGRDATGFSVLFENMTWVTLKQPVAANEFTKNFGQAKYSEQEDDASYRNMLKTWQKVSRSISASAMYIAHARKGTKGSEYDTDNNHPIVVNEGDDGVANTSIIGVHNGKIENDAIIFERHAKEMTRVGEVDSEAIFQMQKLRFSDVAPTKDTMLELDKYLRGTYAILTMNNKFPKVLGLLRRSRPLEIAFIGSGLDLIAIASTKTAIEDSIDEYNRYVSILGNSKLPFIKGTDVEYKLFGDDTAGCIDVSKEVDNIKDCVDSEKMEYPRTTKSTLADYNVKTTASNNYSHTTSYNKPVTLNREAFIVDTTHYSGSGATHTQTGINNTPSDEEETVSAEIAAGLDIRVVSKGADLMDGDEENITDFEEEHNVLEDQEKDPLQESLENVIDDINARANSIYDHMLELEADSSEVMSEVSEACPATLWISGITNENVCSKIDMPSQPSLSDIKQATEDTYSRGFSGGYTLGRLLEQETLRLSEKENSDVASALSEKADDAFYELAEQVDRLKKQNRKAVAVVANLKSLAMALIATSHWVEIQTGRDGDTFLINGEVSDISKGINKNFSMAKALEVISATENDVNTVINIIEAYDQEEDSFNQSDREANRETLEDAAKAT